MMNWQESVYSDGTAAFVSRPQPRPGDTVTVRLRLYEDAPVRHVLLRSMPNGGMELTEMQPARREHGLLYYEAPLRINERRVPYQFYLAAEDAIYYYTQQGISTVLPGHAHDFVLLSDYEQPRWVKDAVFYQIFPDRFCNGDEGNDVRSGEYTHDGFPTIRMARWSDTPLSYDEGHCLDFFGGDLRGIEEKIPYLRRLGVTALYLNPIFHAPSVHKYDCIDYFHVDPHLGGDEALASLSRALHENGMKLVLDISINHTGTSHRWFNRDGIYFDKSEGAFHNPDARERGYYFFGPDGRYHGWFGNDNMPTLNYTSEALRETIYRAEDSVLKKWLRPPYSIDGWRFDVADVFGRNDAVQLADELWPQIRQSVRAANPGAYILAEEWDDCTPRLQGDAWDATMNYFGCGRAIRSFLGQDDPFFGGCEALRGASRRMTAQELRQRVTNFLSRLPYALQENQFNLFDSHDCSRLHNDPRVHPEEYRGAVIFQFLLPGAPSIYYGDEAGADGTLGSNEGCRYPMPWGKDFEGSETFRLYQTLAQLKQTHEALRGGGMQFLAAEGRVLALARFHGEEVFVGVLSTEERETTIRLPLGAVGAAAPKREVFGRALRWEPLDDRSIALTVPAHQAYLMECTLR